MPIYKNKGLQGLRSFTELSEEEQNKFKENSYLKNQDIKDVLDSFTDSDWSEAYDNVMFRQAFEISPDDQAYNILSKEDRDNMYRSKIVHNAIAEQFANNKDALWQLKNNGVTDEGLINVLESDYMNDQQWKDFTETTYEDYKTGKKGGGNFAMEAEFGGYNPNWKNDADEAIQREALKQQKILDGIIKEDNKKNIEFIHGTPEYNQALEYFSTLPTEELDQLKSDIVNGYWVDDLGRRVEAVPKYSNEIQNEITALMAEREALLSKNIYEDNLSPDFVAFSKEGRDVAKRLKEVNKRLSNLANSQKTEYDYYYINDDGTRGERVPEIREKTDIELYAEGIDPSEREKYKEDNPLFSKYDKTLTENEVHHFPGSPYYKAFKDNGDFDDYTHSDWAQVVAEYYAMRDRFGENAAKSAVNGKMEKQVADNQSWFSNVGYTIEGKFGVNMMQTISPFVNMHRARMAAGQEITDENGNTHTLTYEEALGNLHAGLNADGTENKVWDIWNPQNISRMERANSFNPQDIWEMEENGGVSDRTHVYQPEDANKMITLEMAVHEGLAMGAYTASSILANYAIGGAFGAAASAIGNIGKAGTWLARAASAASRGIQAASPYVAGMVTSVPIAEGYSQSNFEQILDKGRERIEQLKYQDGMQYVNDLKANNREGYENLINQWINENSAKPKYDEEGKVVGYEGIMAPPNELRRIAEESVDQSLVANYVTNKALWQKDYDGMHNELIKDGSLAYQVNWTEEFLANTMVNYLFRNYMMTPEQKAQLKARNPFFKTYFGESGKAERDLTIMGRQLTKKQFNTLMGIGVGARNVWGGYWSNKMDDVRLAVAQTIGLNKWNNTIDSYYDDDNAYFGLSAFNSTFDFADYYNAARQGFTQSYFAKETIRDGIIGASGSAMGWMPNFGSIARMGQKVAVVDRFGNPVLDSKGNQVYKDAFLYNEQGERKNGWEIAASLVSNGIVQEIANAQEKSRATDRRLNKVNQLIDLYKDDLRDIGELMRLADEDYKIIMTGKPNTMEEDVEDTDGIKMSAEGQLHDGKLRKALKIISLTERWKSDPMLRNSPILQQALQNIESFKENSVSEEDVEAFVTDKKNQKYFRRNMTLEQKKDYARQRLAKNQNSLINLTNEYTKAREDVLEKFFGIDEETFYDIQRGDEERKANYTKALDYMIYNLVLRDKYAERETKLKEELGLTEEAYNPLWYGSRENYELEQTTIDERLKQLNRQKALVGDRIKYLEGLAEPSEDELTELGSQVNQALTNVLVNDIATLEREKNRTTLDDANLSQLGSEFMKAEDILRLPAKEQLKMLTAKKGYTAAQLEEIETAKKIASSKDPDYLMKLNDIVAIRERLNESRFGYFYELSNPKMLLDYVDWTRKANAGAEVKAATRMLLDGYWQQWDNLEGDELENAIRQSDLKSTFTAAYAMLRPEQASMIQRVAGVKGLQESIVTAARNIGEDANQINALQNDFLGRIAGARDSEWAMSRLNDYENWIKENVESLPNARELLSMINVIKKAEDLRKQNKELVSLGEKNIAKVKAESNAKVLTAKLELEKQRKKVQERQDKLRRNRAARNKAKRLSKESYIRTRRSAGGRSSEEAGNIVRKSAAKTAKRILSKILGNKSLGAWKNNMLRNKFISDASIIEMINLVQQYHNEELQYAEFWDNPENTTIEAMKVIEQVLKDKGWSWKGIEEEIITTQLQKDMIVLKTRQDPYIYETISIAENSTPYIYKDGKLLAAPTTDVVIGTMPASEELLATQSKKDQAKAKKETEVKVESEKTEETPATEKPVEKPTEAPVAEEEELTFAEDEDEVIESLTEVPDKPYTRFFGEGREITLGDKIQVLLYDNNQEPYWTNVQVINLQDSASDRLVTVVNLSTGERSGIDFATILSDHFRLLEHASQDEVERLVKALPAKEEQKKVEKPQETEVDESEITFADEEEVEELEETKEKTEEKVEEKPVEEEPEITFSDEEETEEGTPVETVEETPVVEPEEETVVSEIDKMQEALAENPEADYSFSPIEEIPTVRVDDIAVSGEHLNGVNFLPYDVETLRNTRMWEPTKSKHEIVHRVNDWLKGMKIKLQEIVDRELVRILQENPDTNIYFMRVPNKDVSGIVFNVIEYTDNIKRIHDDSLGGVITAETKNGSKQFLVVGTLGYFGQQQQNSYQIIAKQLRQQAVFYSPLSNFVDMTMHTNVSKMQSDVAVKKAEGENSVEYRSIQTLLSDKNRNPYGFTRKSLTYGIMKQSGLEKYNTLGRTIDPVRSELNQGSTYIFIPSANGKYIPVYIQPSTLKEIAVDRDTSLGEHIHDIVERLVTSRDVQTASQVLDELKNYIVFGNDYSHNIEISNEGLVTLKVGESASNKQVISSMQLGDMDAATEFMNRVLNSAIRINVTPTVFSNDAAWKMYNESGALNVDYSRLYTVGATYTVYPVDSSGLPMTGAVTGTTGSRGKVGPQLVTMQYKGEAYYIMMDNPNVWVDKNLNPVKDLETLKVLEAKQAISKMEPVYKNKDNGREYYILDSQKKEAISYDPNTKEIRYLSENNFDVLMARVSNLSREKKAEQTVKQINEGIPVETIVKPVQEEITFAEEEKTEQPDINPEDKIRIESEKNGNFALQEAFITADETLQDGFVEAVVEKVTSDLGKTEGDRVSGMSPIEQIEYLKSKGIQTENINDLQHWIDYLKNCIKLK